MYNILTCKQDNNLVAQGNWCEQDIKLQQLLIVYVQTPDVLDLELVKMITRAKQDIKYDMKADMNLEHVLCAQYEKSDR